MNKRTLSEMRRLVEEPATERLQAPDVNYMELPKGGRFVCGACKYFDDTKGFCGNKAVKAQVSGEAGCCNLYYPAEGEPVAPSKWAVVR